jgi:hypothetical protein
LIPYSLSRRQSRTSFTSDSTQGRASPNREWPKGAYQSWFVDPEALRRQNNSATTNMRWKQQRVHAPFVKRATLPHQSRAFQHQHSTMYEGILECSVHSSTSFLEASASIMPSLWTLSAFSTIQARRASTKHSLCPCAAALSGQSFAMDSFSLAKSS